MENYIKPENTNLPETIQSTIHSINLDANVINMNVKVGSKVANLINYAQNKFEKDEQNQLTWNGVGDSMNKAIACAEIMKKKFKGLYQVNKIGYTRTEEIWNSKLESLRDIKVTKEIPSICIIFSKTPLNEKEIGYQTERTVEDLFKPKQNGQKKPKASRSTNLNTDNSDEIYVKKKKLNTNKK